LLSRLELADLIVFKKDVSKVTIIRDLNELIDLGIVTIGGKGKATVYQLKQQNPLLAYVDAEEYFTLDSPEREAKSSFDDTIFRNLSSLYSEEEISLWEKSAVEFKNRRQKLDPSVYKRELERFVIELSWKSSQIEGNTYSLLEAETLIKQNIQARGHPKEEAVMILNHKDAFEMIIENKQSFKKLAFGDVIQLHNILANGIITAGIRSQPVRISGTAYVPMSRKNELEKALRHLIKHINTLKYPPEKSLVAAVMIAYIQPFADGNKRTSRMLANAILIANDYYPLSYRNVDVTEYRKALVLFYERNNLSLFKKMFLEQLQFAVESYFNL